MYPSLHPFSSAYPWSGMVAAGSLECSSSFSGTPEVLPDQPVYVIPPASPEATLGPPPSRRKHPDQMPESPHLPRSSDSAPSFPPRTTEFQRGPCGSAVSSPQRSGRAPALPHTPPRTTCPPPAPSFPIDGEQDPEMLELLVLEQQPPEPSPEQIAVFQQGILGLKCRGADLNRSHFRLCCEPLRHMSKVKD